jgi:peptidoglycan/LPS O-acetylase OafA/YrhL
MTAVLPPSFFGSFGVALFFLISGFVIPFAFLDRSRVEFAIGRVFRLWPTYAVGLTITALTIWACVAWYGTTLPYSFSTYGLQLLFIRDFAWVPSVDGIVWTLEIEVKFYVLAMLLAGALRGGRVIPILATAAGITAFSIAVSNLPGWLHNGSQIFRVFYALHLSGQMVCYMLIGTIFNLLYRGMVSPKVFILSVVVLFGALAVQWPLGNLAGAFLPGITSYAIALAFFAAAYFGRRFFVNTPSSIRWFADVSYPLYVIHGAAGYVIMRVAHDAGFRRSVP